MAFIDFLAFQEALLLIATAIVGFVALSVYWAMRHNDAAGVTNALKAGAIPIGALGVIATALGVWAEETWPFPAPMASYNVLFTDVYLLFGMTLVILAITMAFHLKLAYVGLFAFVAGAVTASYGWNGYILHMTKDPLETFLMYLAFAGVGDLLVAGHHHDGPLPRAPRRDRLRLQSGHARGPKPTQHPGREPGGPADRPRCIAGER